MKSGSLSENHSLNKNVVPSKQRISITQYILFVIEIRLLMGTHDPRIKFRARSPKSEQGPLLWNKYVFYDVENVGHPLSLSMHFFS